MYHRLILSLLLLIHSTVPTVAQEAKASENVHTKGTDQFGAGSQADIKESMTLDDCLKFALKNQPAIHKAQIDEAIAGQNKSIAFSSWLPQVSGTANLQHYFQLPTAISNFGGTQTLVSTGVYNYSLPQLTATQRCFVCDQGGKACSAGI
jgi:outer membrane protein TolC